MEIIEEPAGDLTHEEHLVHFNSAAVASSDAPLRDGSFPDHLHEEHSAADEHHSQHSSLASGSLLQHVEDTAVHFQQEVAGMLADDNAMRFEITH
jgi:hypothetical protein